MPEPASWGAPSVVRGAIVVLLALVVLVGCGGSSSDRVVVRVGRVELTEAGLRARMLALAGGGSLPDSPHFEQCASRQQALFPGSPRVIALAECRARYAMLEHQALGSLIASAWLVGEGVRRGPPRVNSAADVAGLMRLAKGAEGALRNRAETMARPVTQAQVVAYYGSHRGSFERPERRYFAIDESYESERAARAALRDGRFADIRKVGYHESLARSELAHPIPQRKAITRAVFAARPHTLAGPVLLYGTYSVFEVTRVRLRRRTTLAQARNGIVALLEARSRTQALEALIGAWRWRWIAETHCTTGHVIQKCGNYRGARVPEAPGEFN